MSVFTPVSFEDACTLIARYDLGDCTELEPIAAGVENSNFFLSTTRGRYVLTVFEKIPRADLDFYMGLMLHLHQRGIPCAAPLVDRSGAILQTLHNKPVALVTRLNGSDINRPTAEDCFAIGAALADMHLAAQTFTQPMHNWRGLSWWQQHTARLRPHLTERENALLAAEIAYQANFDQLSLPRGIIHGDLFRDNVLWDQRDKAAVPQMIDFYFACHEQLLLDLAITANDWCLDFACYPEAAMQPELLNALIQGYNRKRPLTSEERAAWPQMLRAAALRTWLGRLDYHHFPRDSASEFTLTHPKDHPFSERLLCFHIDSAGRQFSHPGKTHGRF
ncbi:MAG: homoserine kinase [Betaproteobacteria bacterium]|nr:homoserine kinase [Betaproteobacteria bacterium]